MEHLDGNFLGSMLALLAAVLFGLGMQFTQLGLRTIDSQRGTLLTILSSTVLYWIAAPWYLDWSHWAASIVWVFVLMGLFRPFLSSNLSIAGTAFLGPTISSTLSSTAPFFGLLFGVLILDEGLSSATLAGTVAIVGGVALLARRGGTAALSGWPLWALLLPIGAAIIRVSAHLLAKVGMETVPSPYFVGLVGYTTSSVVALANNARRQTPLGTILGKSDASWFLITGVFYGAAVLTLNFALQVGELSVVAPVVSSEPIFVLILGMLFFRERHIDRRVISSVALVVLGVIVIAMRG